MRKLCWMMAVAILLIGCEESSPVTPTEEFNQTDRSLLIACEGNYGASNASLSGYIPSSNTCENEIFLRANGQLLGDVAQSMTLYDGKIWICSNNSGVIFAIDPTTYKEVGRILIPGPRYIHFLSPEKAYVTQLWDNRIAIVNPKTYTALPESEWITTEMEASQASTEQLVQIGRYVYVNCWSYQRSLLKIDTQTDRVVATLEVDIQPAALTADKNGKLWTLCDGGQWDGNPLGYEAPTLLRIDPDTFSIEARFTMNKGEFPAKLQCNLAGDRLYWLNNGLWSMSVDSTALPAEAAFSTGLTAEYGLTIDPSTEEIYVSDAVDYTQAGTVARFSPEGGLIDTFTVGICPSAFVWIP